MFNPWSPQHSVLREKVVEHLFIAELSSTLLLDLKMPFELLRSEFDAFGYDLVIEANGVVRHIQLKTLRATAKTAQVDIQLALREKPGGCVVWMLVDPDSLKPGPFLWLGGRPGCPLPPLGDREVKHSRGHKGDKKVRPGLRRIPKGEFTRIETIRELAIMMFGQTRAEQDRILIDHLSRNGIELETLVSPDRLDWARAGQLAGMVDAYALAEDAGLGDPGEVAIQKRKMAERTGEWSGTALDLWITVCMEHLMDKWQSEGAIGLGNSYPPLPLIGELAQALGEQLAMLGWPRRAPD